MKYTIYMLKECPENTSKRFMSYRYMEQHGGISFSDYEAVYTGHIAASAWDEKTLEAIYYLLNRRHPNDYVARSLSVSDLIMFENGGLYYCDSIGFRPLVPFRDANGEKTALVVPDLPMLGESYADSFVTALCPCPPVGEQPVPEANQYAFWAVCTKVHTCYVAVHELEPEEF